MRRLLHLTTFVTSLVAAPALLAQARASSQPAAPANVSKAVARAAETITKAGVAHHIGVIADDSMMGRDTPSPGLEKTARYVADQFKKFGLKPGGDSGTWFQHYPIQGRKLDFSASRIVFTAGGKDVAAGFTTAARLAAAVIPEQSVNASVVVVSGRQRALQQADVADKLVLYVPSAGQDSAVRLSVMNQIFMSSKGLVILSDLDSAAYNQRLRSALQRPMAAFAPTWAAHVRVEAAPGLAELLAAGGLDVAKLRADTTPMVQPLPQLTVRLEATGQSVTAPNTVGILEGSDPTLKDEYVVFSAHMDHIGISSGQPDSINNGADDDGSGTTAVMELAEAFSRPGARPKRSIIFLTVSGEEKGLWGSAYFATHSPVPLKQVVADLNIDMIGRNWKDTVVAIGKEHSDLGATLNRVNAAHPELGMTAIDDIWPQEQFYFRSDHYNFASRGVPILFFFTGVHPDYHQPSDSPDKIDTEKEARIIKLIYYLGQDVANATDRPKWNEASYKQIVKPQP